MGNLPVSAESYTQFWFERGMFDAAVISDGEHISWFDLELGITGSTLSDGNAFRTRDATIKWIQGYLEDDVLQYYRTIETNDPQTAAVMYPNLVHAGFLFIPIRPNHITTRELVKQKAGYEYTKNAVYLYRDQQRIGVNRPLFDSEFDKLLLQQMRVESPIAKHFLDREPKHYPVQSMDPFDAPKADEKLRISDSHLMKLPPEMLRKLRGLRTTYDPVKQETTFYGPSAEVSGA